MPRESISTPSGASCRRPIPTSRHKKGNPFTPKCLVCRYVCAVMLYSPQFRFCAAPSRPPLFPPQSFPCRSAAARRFLPPPLLCGCTSAPRGGHRFPAAVSFPAMGGNALGRSAGNKKCRHSDPGSRSLSSRVSSASSGRIAPWRRASYSIRCRSCRGR